MKYIECPREYKGKLKSLFLAGGITGCVDWQSELVDLLKDLNIAILNPRRKLFSKDNPNIEMEQIDWEYRYLKKADAVSFRFTKETICPITLYELGKVCMMAKPVFISIHPDYSRKRDIEIQTKLFRPEIKIVYTINDLSSQIRTWAMK